jgi:hypothetical protein
MSRALNKLYIVPRVAMTRAQVIATITSAFHCLNREYSGLLAGNNNADADAELKEVLTWIKKRKTFSSTRP